MSLRLLRSASPLALALLLGTSCAAGTTTAARPAEAPAQATTCPQPALTTTELAGPSGAVRLLVPHPADWTVERPEPNQLLIQPPDLEVAAFFSVFEGVTPTPEDVQNMEHQALGQLEAVEPFREVSSGGDHRVFLSMRRGPDGLVAVTAVTGEGGFMFSTLHVAAELTECQGQLLDQILSGLDITFAPAAAGPCPDSFITNFEVNGGCLQIDLVGAARVEACGSVLESRGWKRQPKVEEAIGNATGQKLRCYER